MTIFKSHQVNLDPEPYVDRNGTRWASAHADISEPPRRFDPRPEFEPTRDPYPWESSATNSANGKHRAPAGYSDDGRGLFVWAPRREQFDTPVNPILAALRTWDIAPADALETLNGYSITYDHIDDWCDAWEDTATPAQIEHARPVLARLANFTKD